jgi:hypothetical protein
VSYNCRVNSKHCRAVDQRHFQRQVDTENGDFSGDDEPSCGLQLDSLAFMRVLYTVYWTISHSYSQIMLDSP